MNGQTQGSVLGGALGTLIIVLLNHFLPTPLPDAAAGAIITLCSTIVTYLIPASANPAKSVLRMVRLSK
jgi:hypothetical protein